jgi:hypothetical protein
MTTYWIPFPKYGSYYRLHRNTLFCAPMLRNGDIQASLAIPIPKNETDEVDHQLIIQELQSCDEYPLAP